MEVILKVTIFGALVRRLQRHLGNPSSMRRCAVTHALIWCSPCSYLGNPRENLQVKKLPCALYVGALVSLRGSAKEVTA